VLFAVVGAVLVIGAVLAFVLPLPNPTLKVSVVTTTTLPCSSAKLASDYQIDQCLESIIRVRTAQMDMLSREESDYFRYTTTIKDLRVARRIQSTFTSYARQECLAEANPYQTGTIVPILFGECEIGFFDQRLVVLRNAIAIFKRGGEAQGAP
jgi:hypothetical protein